MSNMKELFLIHGNIKTQLIKVQEILRTRYGVEGNIVTNKTKQSQECQSAYDEGVMVGSADGLTWALEQVEVLSEGNLAEEEF